MSAITWALGILIVVPVLVLLFADELVRLVSRDVSELSPVSLPVGSEIRVSDRLVRLLGFGTGSGAAAVTVGYTILIPADALHLPLGEWGALIRHEAVHCRQRRRLGRSYLIRYVAIFAWLFVRHGRKAYELHPFEIEAREHAAQAASA